MRCTPYVAHLALYQAQGAKGGILVVSKRLVAIRLSTHHQDILDALVYIESKRSGRSVSPNDVLNKVVSDYLDDHAQDRGVQASIRAAEEATVGHRPAASRVRKSAATAPVRARGGEPSDAA